MEESLRKSEERLLLAMSSANIGFWDWDVINGQITWSPELCEIFGVEAGTALTYEDFRSRVHPDDLAAVESERDTAIRNHKQYDLEFRIIRPGGEIRWLTARGKGYYDESDDVMRVVGSAIDITERKRLELALREREQRLRLALDASRAACWMWDARTGRVDWDGPFRDIYGFSAGDLASFEAWLSRVHEEDRPKVVQLWDEIQHTKAHDTFDTTFRIVRPNGTVSWIQSLGQVHRDAEGQVMQLTGLDLDVTARRRAEDVFRENQDREAFLLRLADALRPLSDPLDMQEVAARLLGEHLRVNRAGYAEIEGDQYIIRREYVNGAGPLVGSGPTSTFGAGMSEMYRRGEPVAVNDVNTDPRFSDRDRALYLGKQIAALVGVMLLKDGRLVAAFGVNTSTSRVWTPMEVQLIHEVAERTWAAVERAHAEAELRKAHDTLERRVGNRTAELEARNAQLRRLASQLTLTEQNAREQLAKTLHDGLQQLLFIAGITLDRAVKSTSQADQVGLLQNARAKVNEAMEAARTLSVDLFPPVLHAGGLPAALDWLARRTQEQYGVVVDVTADARANPEAGDVRILLFEAVRELLFNAIKHAHTDRVDINLAVRPGDIIHIDVSDEGVGFDPAVTRHHKDQHQVGLGLFSIQERFALLGGHLHIQSAPGKGARFSLTLPPTSLPHVATDGAEIRYDSALREGLVYASSSGRSKSLRILVADDHVVARAGLRELFSERPELQVVGEAANGVEAISQATALQPDVIVMDVSMPQMNGIEATRQIHRTLPHIRIVGLSTYDDEDIKRSMREAGAEAYFTKNESTDRLLDHLLSIHPTAKTAARS